MVRFGISCLIYDVDQSLPSFTEFHFISNILPFHRLQNWSICIGSISNHSVLSILLWGMGVIVDEYLFQVLPSFTGFYHWFLFRFRAGDDATPSLAATARFSSISLSLSLFLSFFFSSYSFWFSFHFPRLFAATGRRSSGEQRRAHNTPLVHSFLTSFHQVFFRFTEFYRVLPIFP